MTFEQHTAFREAWRSWCDGEIPPRDSRWGAAAFAGLLERGEVEWQFTPAGEALARSLFGDERPAAVLELLRSFSGGGS